MLSVGILALPLSSAAPSRLRAELDTCKHGHDGFLVSLKSDVKVDTFAESLRSKWHREQRSRTNYITHNFSTALRGISATLDPTTLDSDLGQLLKDPRVSRVEPNCRIVLDPMEMPVLPATKESQAGAPWGLDRIDSRSGRDNTYNYGTATGSDSIIYVQRWHTRTHAT